MKYTVEELADAKTTSPEVRDMLLALEKDSKRYRFCCTLSMMLNNIPQSIANAMNAAEYQVNDHENPTEDEKDAIIDAGIIALEDYSKGLLK